MDPEERRKRHGKTPRNKAHKRGIDYFLGEAELVAYARKRRIFGEETMPMQQLPANVMARGKRRARSSSIARSSAAPPDMKSESSDDESFEYKRPRRQLTKIKVGSSAQNPIALSSESSDDETINETTGLPMDNVSSSEEEWSEGCTRGGFDQEEEEDDEETEEDSSSGLDTDEEEDSDEDLGPVANSQKVQNGKAGSDVEFQGGKQKTGEDVGENDDTSFDLGVDQYGSAEADGGDGWTLVVVYPNLDLFEVLHNFPLKLVPAEQRLQQLLKEVESLRDQLTLVQSDRDKLCEQLCQQEEENERALVQQVEEQEQQSREEIERRVAKLVQVKTADLVQAQETEKRNRDRARSQEQKLLRAITSASSGENAGIRREISPTKVSLYDNKRRVSRVDTMLKLRALDQLSLELELLDSVVVAPSGTEEWLRSPMPAHNRFLVVVLDEHALHA
eukprot:jgi/Phyca11/21795/fgenesh1_pg.PHYCAscaffold_122_\